MGRTFVLVCPFRARLITPDDAALASFPLLVRWILLLTHDRISGEHKQGEKGQGTHQQEMTGGLAET